MCSCFFHFFQTHLCHSVPPRLLIKLRGLAASASTRHQPRRSGISWAASKQLNVGASETQGYRPKWLFNRENIYIKIRVHDDYNITIYYIRLPYITLSIRGTRLWDKATWLNKLVTGLYGFVVFWTESLSVQKRSRVELATCSVSTNVIMLRLETLFWIHIDQDFVSPISGTQRCSLPTGIIFPSFHCVVRGLLLQADPQGEWSEMHWDGLDGCDHRVLIIIPPCSSIFQYHSTGNHGQYKTAAYCCTHHHAHHSILRSSAAQLLISHKGLPGTRAFPWILGKLAVRNDLEWSIHNNT